MAIDTGGTFTDVLGLNDQGQVMSAKVFTTPHDYSIGFMDALQRIAQAFRIPLEDYVPAIDLIVHGTTIGVNTVLTRTGARTGVITTAGFRDILYFRRGRRWGVSPYNMKVALPPSLVPRYLRQEVEERVSATGEVLTPLNERQVEQVAADFQRRGVEATAICFLHSYANPEQERAAARAYSLIHPDAHLVLSSDILPAIGEYERFSTAVVSAYITPALSQYLTRIEELLKGYGFAGSFLIVQGNGGVESPSDARRKAVTTLGSGPASAPLADLYYADLYGWDNVISMDMGGTSFDACLIVDRTIPTTTETWVGDQRVAVKALDVRSIGAGGGSIAWFDSAGLLRVGPKSAAGYPGPVCYSRGGSEITVTDADLILGYIPEDYFLGGEMRLDLPSAKEAIADLAKRLGGDPVEAAHAIFRTINSSMADTITEISTKRGYDPRDFVLIVGGGAGPVHGARIAQEVGIRDIIVPRLASLYCSFGMMFADLVYDYVRSFRTLASRANLPTINRLYEEMELEGLTVLVSHGVPQGNISLSRSIDMRYVGQYHEIEVPVSRGALSSNDFNGVIEAFHRNHQALYTFHIPGKEIEMLNLRVKAVGLTSKPRPPQLPLRGTDPSRALKRRRMAHFPEMGGYVDTPVYAAELLEPGHRIEGPAIVEEPTTTIVIPPGVTSRLDQYSTYILRWE